MRKILLFIASSLDGYIAGKNGEISWLFSDHDYGYSKFFSSVDTVIMGRKTYELSMSLEPEPFPGKKICVFSRQKAKGSRANFSDDPIATAMDLKKKAGKDIWLVGGCEINTILLENGLIDELILSQHPLFLGSGIPVFRNAEITRMGLKKVKKFPSGLVQLHYLFDL